MQPPSLELPRSPGVQQSRLAFWLDLALNQAAWWYCILSARLGHPFLAVLGPLSYVVGHVVAAPRTRPAVLALSGAGALAGFAGDALLVRSGLLSFPPGFTLGPVAPFMVLLWAMFAVSLRGSSAFVTRLPGWQVALLGAAAGPLAYAGGERLSVLELANGALWAVSLEWAVAVPLLALAARLETKQRRP